MWTAQELTDGTVLVGGNFNSLGIYDGTTGAAAGNFGPVSWLESNRALIQAIKSPMTGDIKKIIPIGNNNFFVGDGQIPACLLIKNTGTVDPSYSLTFPKGIGTDIVKESDTSILVTGALTYSDTQTATVGISRIRKK